MPEESVSIVWMQVVIVLTSGEQISDISTVTPNSDGVYLFVYNFVTNRTAQCHPSGRASMEDVPVSRLDNPLYALRSYFTFMATLHNSSMTDSVDYGTRSQDYSGIDSFTFTLSKAGILANLTLIISMQL